MKASPLQTKRCPKKARFRLLHAHLTRRKQRVAATAPTTTHLDSDEPNLSVARALIVILLIHIVAISGIFIHNHFFSQTAGGSEAGGEAPQSAAVVAAPVESERLPILREGDEPYIVQTGDTYPKIAAARGVAEDDLRRVNENIPLRSGRILKMPGRRIVALEPSEMERVRTGGLVSTAQPAEQPLLVTPHGGPASDSASGATTISNPAPRAIIVEPAAPTDATTATSHTVVSGDTLWRIASKYKVTTDALMKANGIDDPKKLRLGMTLKVPAAN